MRRLYERLASANAIVGTLALVFGLAALPQTASGAVPLPNKKCDSSCSVWWNSLAYKCELLVPCDGPCACKTSNQIDEQTGTIINCRAEGCYTY